MENATNVCEVFPNIYFLATRMNQFNPRTLTFNSSYTTTNHGYIIPGFAKKKLNETFETFETFIHSFIILQYSNTIIALIK